MNRFTHRFTAFARSKRAVEVLTGNLMMIMVMAAVFSSIAFIVKSSSDRISEAEEKKMVQGIAIYLNSKVSETWGVGADEIPLDLPRLIGGGDYVIQMDPSGTYFIIKTRRATYRIKSSGIRMSRQAISSSQPHNIGIRDGEVVIDPPPLTEIIYPLDGAVFAGPFNLSYRVSKSTTEHRIYLDGQLVTSSPTSLDGLTIDPNTSPTNVTDGQHILAVVAQNSYGEGVDYLRFVVDRNPPDVVLNMTQLMTDELLLTVTEKTSYPDCVELYVFVVDDKLLPVRELDTSNFYIYDNATEFSQGGRFSQSIVATDSTSMVDPHSYLIGQDHSGVVQLAESKESSWDSKDYNGTITFWGTASDIAGNTKSSDNVTKSPINRHIEVGAPDRKSDLSVIFTNDVSGSMEWVMWKDEYPKPGEESRLDFMKAAVKRFIDKMFPEDEAAICSFATNYQTGLSEIVLRKDFTPTDDAGKSALAATVDVLTTRDGTPLYDALYQSILWVKDRDKFKAILVLTDGKDLNYATGLPYSNRTSDEVIDLARAEGIPIYCVGLGEEDKVDVGVLTSISDQTEGRFYLAPTPERLTEAYDQIAGELLSGYKIIYKPGFVISGGERITMAVYDKDGRSGSVEIVLPAPEVVPNLAPIVSLNSPNGGEIWAGVKTISWTASDPEGDAMTFDIYYSDDGSANWSYIDSVASGVGPTFTYEWDTSTVSDGTQYSIKVVANDGTNQASDESDGLFEISNASGDGIAPAVQITKPTYPPAKKVKDVYTIQGTASDTGGSGLDRVEIEIARVPQGQATLLGGDSWDFDFDTTTMANGVVTVDAIAYDGAGNSATDTIQMEINN